MKEAIAAVLLAASLTTSSLAGECVRSDEYYLECLEGQQVAYPYAKGASGCLVCIGIPRQLHLRWGSEAEREQLFSKQKFVHRDRLIAVAGKYLVDGDVALVAAQVLAFQGIQEVADVDIFELLTTTYRRSYASLWYTLAALQDPRTISFAEQRYLEIHSEVAEGSSKMRSELLDIIDCLYHFRTEASRAALKRIAAGEEDKNLRQYIRKTVGV